jgi:hypothetical protein
MSNILYNTIEPAANFNARIQAQFPTNLPKILASEVMSEMETRCGSGQQYTTFPNTISDDEKAKLTAEGYIITENTIDSEYRDGCGDTYIGFQVALNETAAEKAMVISQVEENGIQPGSSFDPTQAQLDAMNSGITAEKVGNYDDMDDRLAGIKSTTDESITMQNDDTLVISTTTPSGDIPDNAIGVSF